MLPIILLFFSCNKPKDDQPPQIRLVKTESGAMQHGSGLHALAGTTLKVKITTSDNEGLNSIQCDIGSPEEEHSHAVHEGGSVPFLKSLNQGKWDTGKSLSISGTENSETLKFEVPDSVTGAWNVTVAVLDNDGNITYRNETMVIQNDSIPFFLPVAVKPDAGADGVVTLNTGQQLLVYGNIMDGDYLQSVHASLRNEDALIWQQDWTIDNAWLFGLDQIAVPDQIAPGNYELYIEATDMRGWTNSVSGSIVVKPTE